MQAIHITEPGLSHFKPVTLPIPEPAPGEILVKINAAALNALDLLVAKGNFPGLPYPFVPVSDAAGEVSALGAGVSNWQIGDRVTLHYLPYWVDGPLTKEKWQRIRGVTWGGSLAQYVTVPANGVIATPDYLTDQLAATLSIAATTAWRPIRAAPVLAGTTVLLLGTGGVSLFALQYAKAAGATVLLTSSSNEKLERARQLGADHLINYREQPEWAAKVREITQGHGVDVVVETGGSATFAQSVEAVGIGGRIFTIGVLSGHQLTASAYSIMQKQVTIQGVNSGSVADLQAATDALAALRLQPVIDREFDWQDASAAYHWLDSGSHVGKVVLTVSH